MCIDNYFPEAETLIELQGEFREEDNKTANINALEKSEDWMLAIQTVESEKESIKKVRKDTLSIYF